MHGISKPMKVFLEKLRSVDIKGKKAFAFGHQGKDLVGWKCESTGQC